MDEIFDSKFYFSLNLKIYRTKKMIISYFFVLFSTSLLFLALKKISTLPGRREKGKFKNVNFTLILFLKKKLFKKNRLKGGGG